MWIFAHEEVRLGGESFFHRLNDFIRTPVIFFGFVAFIAVIFMVLCVIFIYRSLMSKPNEGGK